MENLYLEDEFGAFLLEIQKLKANTVKAYLGTFKKNLKLVPELEFNNIKNITDNTDLTAVYKISHPRYQKSFKISNKTFDNITTHYNRYKEFLVYYIEQKMAKMNFDDDKSNIDFADDFIIEEEYYSINEKDFFSKDLIKDKFKFRLITQNRFNKCGLFYPISFLKQYFYKTGDKVYFDNLIENKINKIRFCYQENKHYDFITITSLKTDIGGNLYFNTKDRKEIPLLSHCHESRQYKKFNINDFSDIAIDHMVSMNTLLNKYKEKKDFVELQKISDQLKKHLHTPLTYKKLIAKGTRLSNDAIFISTINREKLKTEFELIVAEMDLQLMHQKHNNFKRHKV